MSPLVDVIDCGRPAGVVPVGSEHVRLLHTEHGRTHEPDDSTWALSVPELLGAPDARVVDIAIVRDKSKTSTGGALISNSPSIRARVAWLELVRVRRASGAETKRDAGFQR